MKAERLTFAGKQLPALACLLVMLTACESPKAVFGEHPMEFSDAPPPRDGTEFYNWSVPPQRVEEQLKALGVAGKARPLEWKRTETGASGPKQYLVEFPTLGKTVKFKWQSVPTRFDTLNNSPRREVAAYELQKLFLDAEDYVVPTTFVICTPNSKNETPWNESSCALGAVALWLQNVEVPETFYDSARFASEPAYAYYMSNLNLFTYLIGHSDGNRNNFLVSDRDQRRQVFSIDNDVAFEHIPNVFVRNWDVIRVPALHREAVDRLRRLTRADLDFLAVVTELKKDDRGVFVPVPPGTALFPQLGAGQSGDTLQFGLTESEIDRVWARIRMLVTDVDSGKIGVF